MMKTTTFKRTVLSATALLMSFSVFAQEEKKFEIAPAADLVSSYVWRGMYQTGPSVQPSLGMSYAGLSLTAWGSTDFSTSSDEYKAKEFDLTLGYGIGGFSIAVTDYWWSGEGARYGRYATDHYFEGTIGYNFGEKFPLSLTWSTMFAGGDKKENGDQFFSSYFEAAYDINVWGVRLHPFRRDLTLERDVQRRLRHEQHLAEGKQGDQDHGFVLAAGIHPSDRCSRT